MKKLIVIFIAALVVVFALGAVYAMNQKKEEIATNEYNPYDKTNLNAETIKLLSDENYQNIITLTDLEKKITAGGTGFA